MASTLTSPGVLSIENDQSFITQQPITVGAAIIGPTVLGPVEIPTIVTSYSDYKNKFGSTFLSGSQVYTYFTSIAAFNYFNNGGESLLVSRVVSGTFTSAFTSASAASSPTPNGSGILNLNNSESIVLSTLSQGTIMNSSGSLDASGSLNASGSANNIRWQIVNNDTSSGTFSLLIREGDDNTNNPVTLETWTNLSMDPTAPNYVSRVIGNQVRAYSSVDNQIAVTGDFPNASKYVYVSAVKTPTPLYFDNTGIAKSQFTALIPVNASGSFIGATGDLFYGGGANYYNNISSSSTNTQGISASNYGNMINLLSNQDDYRFNVLMTPGLFAQTANLGASQVTSIINNTLNRGDNIYVSDLVPFNATITEVTTQANAKNTSYAASYWPWVQTIDPDSAQLVWVPASTMIGGVYAYNDSVSEPWFAPAGINRGGLSSVVRAEKKLSQANRDTLYTNKVNPIATFPGTGVVVYGQKTLQTKASALDRVNVRRLLIALKSYIGQVANNLVFEQNTIATRTSFLNQVNPYLESVQQRQGLYAFKVVMDSSNNTPDVIDRNQLVGQIYLQPTKTAEFVYLNFNILPTGVSFPA
jgi:phage tail sheath protein FI